MSSQDGAGARSFYYKLCLKARHSTMHFWDVHRFRGYNVLATQAQFLF
jgi:hypothetical protein